MGVTKQAAQQRFLPRGPVKDTAGFGDFSRFTTRARSVLAAAEGGPAAARVPLGLGAVATLKGARRSALHLGHNYIGTEHILLGLVDEQDATAATLAGLGETKPGVQQQITAAFAALRASRNPSGSGA